MFFFLEISQQNSCRVRKKYLPLRKFITTMGRTQNNEAINRLRNKQACCYRRRLNVFGITVFN